MTRPRTELVSITDTPYYHITSRCVRRAFLCGIDNHTKQSYEHRRQWIVDRIRILSSIFAIDVCAYAVMSNHYHIVVKLTPQDTDSWSNNEVIKRWTQLFKGPLLIHRYQKHPLTIAETNTVEEIVQVWRKRLGDLSWFMKCLNEYIARAANKEDNCKGHFWESRYTSQALLTEQALLSCMAYVDLNPIRAAMASTPETSDYSSIKERITPTQSKTIAIEPLYKPNKPQNDATKEQKNIPLKPLLHFDDALKNSEQFGIPFSYSDYLALFDWTGRIIRNDKRGYIQKDLPPILERLNIDKKQWLRNSTQFEYCYQRNFNRRKKKTA